MDLLDSSGFHFHLMRSGREYFLQIYKHYDGLQQIREYRLSCVYWFVYSILPINQNVQFGVIKKHFNQELLVKTKPP